ncbi:hypothetical protein D3C72_1708690 [compost metagenome]
MVGLDFPLVLAVEDALAEARGQEHGAAAGVLSQLDVGGLVADDVGAREVDAVLRGGELDQLGFGLAAVAGHGVLGHGAVGEVGAVVEVVEVGAFAFEELGEPVVQRVEVGLGVVAAGGAGLVRDEDGQHAEGVELADGLGGSGDQVEVERVVDVAHFLVDGAVAIEKDGRTQSVGTQGGRVGALQGILLEALKANRSAL